MKQNDILMIAGIGALGIAAFTMMNKGNSQSQQMQQQMMLQQMMLQQANQQRAQQPSAGTNTGGGSSAPKQSTVDQAKKWVDTAGNVADIFKNIFNGTPNIRPLI